MRALVTGATGFVGSHIAETLVRQGHEVRALVRRTSERRWIQDLELTLYYGDLENPSSLHDALHNVEWLFHVAGVTKASRYASYLQVNAEGTRRLLQICLEQAASLKRVVLISSLGAAGPCAPQSPKLESDPCKPVSHYGLSKLEAERIARSCADRIPLVIIRPPAVYGPRDGDLLAFFRLIQKGIYLTIGHGERYICMLHVRDLAEGVLRAAEADVPSGSTFFLSDGAIHTWSEIAALLSSIMKVSIRRIRVPVFAAWLAAVLSEIISRMRGVPPLLNRQKLQEILQTGWTCDIQNAVSQLQFEPKVSLESGLTETYEWYRRQGWLSDEA